MEINAVCVINQGIMIREAEGRGGGEEVLPWQGAQEGLSEQITFEQRSDGERSQVGPEHSRQRKSKCKGPEVGMSLLFGKQEEWLHGWGRGSEGADGSCGHWAWGPGHPEKPLVQLGTQMHEQVTWFPLLLWFPMWSKSPCKGGAPASSEKPPDPGKHSCTGA